MLRTIRQGSRLLLTGVLIQQTESVVENPNSVTKTDYHEKSFWHRLKEYANSGSNGSSRLVWKDENQDKTETYQQIKKDIEENITGWDRLRYLFSINEYQETTPEMDFITYAATIGFFSGFAIGGIREYKRAYELFIYSNDATKFLRQSEAQLALVRATTLAFLKGALSTLSKTTILFSVFATTLTCVSVYRGKYGILEYPVAGAITTALMKWNLGIRGMISGCVSGGLSGLIFGTMIHLFFKATGHSMSDLQYYIHYVNEERAKVRAELGRDNRTSEISKYLVFKGIDLPHGFPEEENSKDQK